MACIDFKLIVPFGLSFPKGEANICRLNRFILDHGLPSSSSVSPLRRSLRSTPRKPIRSGTFANSKARMMYNAGQVIRSRWRPPPGESARTCGLGRDYNWSEVSDSWLRKTREKSSLLRLNSLRSESSENWSIFS